MNPGRTAGKSWCVLRRLFRGSAAKACSTPRPKKTQPPRSPHTIALGVNPCMGPFEHLGHRRLGRGHDRHNPSVQPIAWKVRLTSLSFPCGRSARVRRSHRSWATFSLITWPTKGSLSSSRPGGKFISLSIVSAKSSPGQSGGFGAHPLQSFRSIVSVSVSGPPSYWLNRIEPE